MIENFLVYKTNLNKFKKVKLYKVVSLTLKKSNYKSIIEKKTGNCQATCQLNSAWQK